MNGMTWYAQRLAGRDFAVVDEMTGRDIGVVRGEHDDNAASGSAVLVAAAPELLAALRQAEAIIRHAAQESAGRVKAEIVGGWLFEASEIRSLIQSVGALPVER